MEEEKHVQIENSRHVIPIYMEIANEFEYKNEKCFSEIAIKDHKIESRSIDEQVEIQKSPTEERGWTF